MKVLIIEDEAKATKQLVDIIAKIDDTIQVIGSIVSIEHALLWFKNNEHPNLILSDIQLADGLSFEIYKHVQIQCPIIFCTAFDEYMLEAFESNAISYILKPITIDKVEKALEKFNNLKATFQKEENQSNLSNLINQLKRTYKLKDILKDLV
jgi:two-component system response regulator LytT